MCCSRLQLTTTKPPPRQPHIMCNCDEHTAEVRRAKCWAVTWLVFSILITLSSFSNLFQGILTPGSSPLLTASAGISIIGGIFGIASTSIASCCIPNVPQSPEQLPATKKALYTSFVLQIAAAGIFIVATIILIIGTLQVVQCANNPCPDFTGALYTPRAMPAGCVDSACKEKDFPQPGWQTDTDCTALTMSSDCASGYNVYKATESSLAWDGGFCASRTCCSTSSPACRTALNASSFDTDRLNVAASLCRSVSLSVTAIRGDSRTLSRCPAAPLCFGGDAIRVGLFTTTQTRSA